MLYTGGDVLTEVHQTLRRPTGALHGMVDVVLASMQPMVSSITDDVVTQVETMARLNTSEYSGMIGEVGDMAESYSSLIYGVFAVFSTMALVLSIICISGLVLGAARYSKSSLLTARIRTKASKWSGRLMVGSTTMAVCVAVLFWIPTAILFMVGANLTLMCNTMVDLSIFDKTVDNPTMWGGKTFLNSMVESFISLGDSPHNLTVRHFMEQCQLDHSLYEAVYTSGFLHDLDIVDFDASPDEFLKPIEDFLIYGSTEAITALEPLDLMEMLKPILSNVNIPEFPREIFESSTQSLQDILNAIPLQPIIDMLAGFRSSPLLFFVRNIIDDILNILNPLGAFLSVLTDLLGAIVNQIPFFEGVYNQFKNYITNVIDGSSGGFDELAGVLSGVNRAATTAVGPVITTVFSVTEELIAAPIHKIKHDFGKCGIMANTYEAVVTDMCGHLNSGIHALWLSTAIISVCCPAVVILSFSLTKYVRRANLADAGGRENDKQADKKPPATAPNNDKDGPPQKKRRAWHVFTVSGENVVRPP
ncbi:uncharacterized protein LOC117301496 [Asterias rubens]|uniref:uncharacterized protein LOC117301496 n=1 Tax=Asterias rubens TaxID=7604 RepID=UPI0014559C42|nr:uncharacterized protein LOC117301496 [Asterias rubens]